MNHLGVSAGKLVKLYSTDDFYDDDCEEDWIRLSYGKRKLGLRKKRDGTCIFLSDDKRCTAYTARPISCRVFPIDVVLDEDNDIIDFELSDVIRGKHIKCKLSYKKERSFRSFQQTARQAQSETASYWKKIETWNKDAGTAGKSDFLHFLGLDT